MTSPNRTVSFDKVSIPLNDIKTLSKDKKRQLLMITNMLRDINLLQKYMIFSLKGLDEKNSLKIEENMTTYLFLIKTLISKIHEMWQFIKKHKLQQNKRDLDLKTCQTLSFLEQFYDVNKIGKTFDFIRNKFGFHYEWGRAVEEPIEKAMEVEDFQMLLSNEDSGNNIFVSSNRVTLAVILEEMLKNGYKGSHDVLIRKLIDNLLESAKLFRDFYKMYLICDILNGIQVKNEGKVSVEAPWLSEVALPLIVKNDSPKR